MRTGVLRGHAQPVISAAVEAEHHCVATGCEEGTVRIWDVRQRPSRSCGYLSFGGGEREPVGALRFDHEGDGRALLSSVGSRLFSTDLRQLSISVLLSKPAHHTLLGTAPYEVNSFAMAPCRDSIVAALDDGALWLLDLNAGTGRSLAAHDNICSSVCYAGPSPATHVYSGGLDGRLLHWQPSSSRRASSPPAAGAAALLSVVHRHDQMKTPLSRPSSTAGQIVNPPFVHSLLSTSEGDLVVAGLGDGSLVYYRPGAAAELAKLSFHRSCVPALALIPSSPSVSPPSALSTGSSRAMISGGTDGALIISSLPPVPADVQSPPRGRGARGHRGKRAGQGALYRPRKLLSHEHGQKIQAVCYSEALSNLLVVADLSESPSLYQLRG